LGEEQAALTGKRLAELIAKFKSTYKDDNGNELPIQIRLTKSTMARATQTADIILKHLPEIDKVETCDLIREGAPIEPEPAHPQWEPEPHVGASRILNFEFPALAEPDLYFAGVL
jgi:serine/threonine-protein phosphatase PGAM5